MEGTKDLTGAGEGGMLGRRRNTHRSCRNLPPEPIGQGMNLRALFSVYRFLPAENCFNVCFQCACETLAVLGVKISATSGTTLG